MNIALFGTSADPPTIAHQEIIGWLASQFDRVAVWASDNPFKTHSASLTQRSQMLELSIAEINLSPTQNAQVYPYLSSQRTIETLARAKEIWRDDNFILTIGGDLVHQLPTWYQARELLAQVKLLIVPRTGIPIDQIDLQILTDMGAQIAIAPLSTPMISSTIIRNSKSIQGLTPAIARYIQHQQLYEL